MTAGYVFLLNGDKPSKTERLNRSPVKFGPYSLPWILSAREHGFHVMYGINRSNPEELASSVDGVTFYDASSYRSVLAFRSNIRALVNLLRVIRSHKVEVIHCNTPIGGLVGRIGGMLGGVQTVIYTAHGFHFYIGGGRLRNWIFRSAERALARCTDVIITINAEDFNAAKRFKLRNGGRVYKISGVGIDTATFAGGELNDRDVLQQAGVPANAIVAIAVGDLVPGKRTAAILRSMSDAPSEELHLVVCGEGPELRTLENLCAQLGLEDRVHFLGYRNDVPRLLKASDIFVHLSSREGLPRVVMEAMAAGLPLVLSDIRGNRDLVENGAAALMVPSTHSVSAAGALRRLIEDPALRESMAWQNIESSKQYDHRVIRVQAEAIYQEVLGRFRNA